MTASRPIKRALVSVFHKEGIETLAKAFVEAGTEVVSTGSTAKRLAELGVAVTEVSEVTGSPSAWMVASRRSTRISMRAFSPI